jgi:hypothetical protein
MSLLAKAIAGDYTGSTAIIVGVLWSGPKAEKFKGLQFIDHNIKYDAEQIKRVVQLPEQKVRSFLGSALMGVAGGALLGGAGILAGVLTGTKKSQFHLGIELDDGKKVVITQTPDDRSLQCMLLYVEKKGILEKKGQDLGF